ncbi:hypothetical protein Q0S19_10740 [Stenotrophomonas indicatrix]|uniref:hypothetical protein n=1 Tax=Stenotrophomonas indicatrix TaxID=2045451 RepID=UPI0026557F53|nr:hypothetical protein [Stenotrophomonas indicatrix]MDN8644942.1 hypothetical protein [Stenotrophomonas indicatrix]MDN8655892.1 hypothetical protein [Stenotrophomonas indicatrix]
MRKPIHLYTLGIAIALAFGTPALCILAMSAFGDLCWPQRVGALYVGLCVFIQGFLAADPARFDRMMSDGISLGRHVNQAAYTVAVFGTIFAAFGDLLPASFYYGVAMCEK